MFSKLSLSLSLGAAVIQLIGALVICGYVVVAIASLIPRSNIARARLLIVEGMILGLSVMVSASVLKTIALQTWRQILVLSVILSLRTLLRKLFSWERTRLLARLG